MISAAAQSTSTSLSSSIFDREAPRLNREWNEIRDALSI
jgi:hypothetical protein